MAVSVCSGIGTVNNHQSNLASKEEEFQYFSGLKDGPLEKQAESRQSQKQN